MFIQLGQFVVRHWRLVIALWLLAAVLARVVAPHWNDVAQDGDFAYLPAEMKSVVGERLLQEAFPHNRSKSQIVLIIAREGADLVGSDFYVAYDLARRFLNIHGASRIARAQRLQEEIARSEDPTSLQTKSLQARLATEIAAAEHALEETIRLNQIFNSKRVSEAYRGDNSLINAAAYLHRSQLREIQGNHEGAKQDRQRAEAYGEAMIRRLRNERNDEWPLLDVWTWYEDVFGERLGRKHPHARLIVLHLSNEFMATSNIALMERLKEQVAAVRRRISENHIAGLQVLATGSAAVGGDMLLSARDSIRNTEWFTVILIVGLLVFIYRSPALVLIPLLTIAASLVVSMGLVASLTLLHDAPGFSWFNLQVFTTTRIFVVVILFGTGTDYCLFLISRCQEIMSSHISPEESIVQALGGVGNALLASGLTTIIGLAMMFFTEFGKFRNSGPVIALCLCITLLASLTLTPALLRALQPLLFFSRRGASAPPPQDSRFWLWIARVITGYPAPILLVSLAAMAPLAAVGWMSSGYVTYDFLAGLDARRPSRQGSDLYNRHFSVGDKSPITVVARRPKADFNNRREDRKQLGQLTHALYVEGVNSVRSLTDPMGDYPPGRRISVLTRKAWLTRLMRPHQRTEEVYVSQTPKYRGELSRLDVITEYDPFSKEAIDVLLALDKKLTQLSESPGYWKGAQFAFTGTTAAISDLRKVTQSDTRRIQVLVVMAVLAVLLLVLRKPIICLYMVASVLLTYFVTLGISDIFFRLLEGPDYQGLDWKAPLFLFVILVAIGQDYNVYLATRVFEEQKRLGPFTGLRRAVLRTGGIITSCGLIMAGAFVAMTSSAWGDLIPAWLPMLKSLFSNEGALKAMVQLGFSLATGVLLDTFVVRPVLLPAFLALLCRWQSPAPVVK